MVGQLKGMGTGLLNHHVKEGNMKVGDQQHTLVLLYVSNILMSFNVDIVVMISDYLHLMGGGGRPFIKELM